MFHFIFQALYRCARLTLMSSWVFASLWLITAAAYAQTKPATGQLLNDLPPTINKFPEVHRRIPKPAQDALLPSGLDQASEQETDDAQTAFVVHGLRFEGNTVFTSEELAAVADVAFGSSFTLSALQAHIAHITEHYRKAGYPLASAYLPEQVVQDGVLWVRVSEPKWHSVVLNNRSAIHDEVIQRTARRIRSGELIQDKDLENASVYLSGLPGAEIASELRAGDLLDTTDLVINALPVHPLSSMLTTDNFGSRYTGRERTMAYLAWSNPFHAGDVASLNLLSSGSLLNYQQLGYEIPVLSPGAALGLATTHMQYRLGNGAEALMAHGLLTQMGYWFQYSLDADSQTKTDLRLQYEESAMSDRQDSTDSKNDRHINKWSVSLNWDASSAWWGHAGSTQFNTSVSFGQLFFDDPVSLANDAATAQSSGPFAKWNTRASRSQSLNDAWSLAFSLDMQLANHNLDSTQKMSVGGFHSVRAFESGVLSADEAVFASVECRVHLPPPPANLHVSGEWYGAIFWDAAATRINKKTWSADSNQATLLGSGIGLYWQGKDNWRSSLAVANMQGRLPDALTASGVAMHSVWFELSKGWQ